jgi:hypothetical protein
LARDRMGIKPLYYYFDEKKRSFFVFFGDSTPAGTQDRYRTEQKVDKRLFTL